MIKSILKYLISTALAIALLYWAFSKSDLQWEDIYLTFQKANYNWVVISILVSLFSHLLRSMRWEQLLGAIDYHPKTVRTFSAVMIGYFANFIVPRMGEVSRCGSLQKTADIPFEKSFGTVITERIVDLLGLVCIVGLNFLIEWEPLQKFLFPNWKMPSNLLIAVLILVAGIILFLIYQKKAFILSFWQKFTESNRLGKILGGWVTGIYSIRFVENPFKFILFTILIWLAYFINTYTLLLAFPETQNLGFAAGLTVLVMGTFGMATPTQGGIGAYHTLVASALLFYQIPLKEGAALATFFHGTQMLSILFFGGISFILTLFLPKINAQKTTQRA
jgi:uncharacterized protein (TIRG00374 family)